MNSDRRGFFKKLLGLGAMVVAAPMLPKVAAAFNDAPCFPTDLPAASFVGYSHSYETCSCTSFDSVNVDCVLSDCAITYEGRNS